MSEDKFSLGTTAEDFYKQKEAQRNNVVAVARRLADLTIPTVFPPEDWQEGDNLTICNQSVNSSAVNTLSAKLMLSAMPPGLPAHKFSPKEHKLKDDIESDPELWTEIEASLGRRAEAHRLRMETTNARSTYVLGKRLLQVTGNCCYEWMAIDTPVVHTMHRYVVHRNDTGGQLIVVLRKSVLKSTLDDDILEMLPNQTEPEGETKDWEDVVDIYCVCQLIDGEWRYWQEVNGQYIPDSEDVVDEADPPQLYAAWMIPNAGFDWGSAYCREYEGDLTAVETFNGALQDDAAGASRNLTFVDPTGVTSLKAVEEADNLATIPGNATDVSQLQHNRGAEHSVTAATADKAEKRIGRAFLQHSSIQRQGDRVTMAEWRILAQELDEAMGGLYSQMAVTDQRWYLLRFAYLHEQEDKYLVPLPKDVITIGVITGIDNLGQNQDYTKITTIGTDVSQMYGPQALEKYSRPTAVIRKMTTAVGLKADDLFKSAEEIAEESAQNQQQGLQASLMEKAVGPLAKGGVDALAGAAQAEEPQQ